MHLKNVYKAQGRKLIFWEWGKMISLIAKLLQSLNTQYGEHMGLKRNHSHAMPNLKRDLKALI